MGNRLAHASRICLVLSLTALFTPLEGRKLLAAPTDVQLRRAASLHRLIRKAGNLYKQGKFSESGETLQQVQKQLVSFPESVDEDSQQLLRPIHESLDRARKLLQRHGVELPALNESTPIGRRVSFVQEIAPLLIRKCRRCHIDDTRGDFDASSYASLRRPGESGAQRIVAGSPQRSKLIELIENGEMPRGNGELSVKELERLKRWIAGGAKFDGPSPETRLIDLTDVTRRRAGPATVNVSTGKETVSFSDDVAHILVKHCSNCHGQVRPRSGFRLTSIEALLRGGDSGLAVTPDEPTASLIVGKLKGTAEGQQMPLNQAPLSESAIRTIETWIAEGARFDGDDPNMELAEIAALSVVRHAKHEELSAQRLATAMEHWRLGMPGIAPSRAESQDFLIIGNVPISALQDMLRTADHLATRIRKILYADRSGPLVKGRITLFVFQARYDYSEFGQMVEKREIPKHLRGHWKYSGIDAYGSIVMPKSDEHSLEALIAQQVSSLYVASLGKLPYWFSDGVGRVTASRLDPRDDRARAWNRDLPRIVNAMSNVEQLIEGSMPADDLGIASFGLAKTVMGNSSRMREMLHLLREGRSFDEAFRQSYGAGPSQFAELWAKRLIAAKPRSRQ